MSRCSTTSILSTVCAVTNNLLVCVYHLETKISTIDWLSYTLSDVVWLESQDFIECQHGSDYGSQGQSEYNISWATVVVASVHSAIVLASQVLTWSFNIIYALHQWVQMYAFTQLTHPLTLSQHTITLETIVSANKKVICRTHNVSDRKFNHDANQKKVSIN